MVRLRRVSVSSPGYSRQFVEEAPESADPSQTVIFLDPAGEPLRDEDEIMRCTQLAVPPAWRDVWICQYPGGHIQAFGYDDAGRGQYIYHEQWRERRDRAKHDHVLEVARKLPAARGRVTRALRQHGMPRSKALALAFRLLDLAYFRAGSEVYARTNNSFGLATIRKEHAVVHTDGTVEFRYPAKSGKVREVIVADDAVRDCVTMLREVAAALGNTPAVARASYIDSRLFDLWEHGQTIGRTRSQSAAESAVIELLG